MTLVVVNDFYGGEGGNRYGMKEVVGMPRLTKARKELLNQMMKETIYTAAVSVLVEHGFEKMTMERVAAAAGMAKGSLYNYFRDKRDLISFIHEKMVEPLLAAHDETIHSPLSAPEKLRAMLRSLFDHMKEHREVIRTFVRDETVRPFLEPTKRAMLATALEQTAAIIQQGIDEGVFRPHDPKMQAQLYVGGLVELVNARVTAGEPLEGEELIETVLDLYFRGIVAPERPVLGFDEQNR